MAYNPEEARFYEREILNVLTGQWNPVTSSNREETGVECLAYAGRVYRKLISEDPEKKIFEFLWDIETKELCLPGDEDHTRKIAAVIVDLRNNRPPGE